VIIFSPHPDDDVISMGGTFQRLVNQGHEVHVAYQTSGNIAVGDEEVIRYISVLNSMRKKFNPENTVMLEKYEKIRHYLMHEKRRKISIPPTFFSSRVEYGVRRLVRRTGMSVFLRRMCIFWIFLSMKQAK